MRMKKALFQIFKLVVSAGLIIFLLNRKSPEELAPYLRSIDPALLAGGLIVFLTSSLLGALQWHILLGAGGVELPVLRTVRLYFVGLFFNNFLPANVGGDAVKIFDVVKDGNDPHKVFAITLLDRVFGITGLCLLAVVTSFFLLPSGTVDNMLVYIAVFLMPVAAVALLSFNRRLSRKIREFSSGIRLWGLGERIGLVLTHMGSLRNLKKLFGKVLFLSLLIQVLRIVTHIFVGKALGLELAVSDYLHFFIFIPLLGLVMILPISINGLGVRESAGIVLFTQIGISEEQAVLMEFITYLVQVAVSLAGGVMFVLGRRGGRRGEI